MSGVAPDGLALDPGLAWVKRVRLQGGRWAVWPDAERGRLRTPRAALGADLGAALGEVWERAGRPTALSLVAGDEETVEPLRALADRATPGARVVVLPAALAASLELPPQDRSGRDAVLDLGHAAVRLQALEWRGWEGRVYPRPVGPPASVPLGGGRLDEELAAVCLAEGGGRPSPQAAGFAELKELLDAARGPFVRPLLQGGLVELPAREAGEVLRGWLEGLASALLTLVEAAREREVGRVLAVGGLVELGPVRELLERAFAGGPRLLLADRPGFAACRGVARALLEPPAPAATRALGVPLRRGARVELGPLVPAGAALSQASFGPLLVRPVTQGAQGAPESDTPPDPLLRVHLLDPAPDGPAWVARVPRGGEPLPLGWRWSWEQGWECLFPGGAAPAEPAPPAEAAALRRALALEWAARGRELPLDLLVLFRATRAAPAGGALAAAAAERVLLAAAQASPGARLRALAVGDHPQGHIVPAWVTRLSPAWSADPAPVLGFVRELLAEPADGIDPQEAFECALREAAGLDWRPEANRLVLVLADAPPHTPEEPPYCPVDWRAEAARLRTQGVHLLPAHLVAGGVSPSLRQAALTFLQGLGSVVTVRAGALDDLEAAVRAAAVVRAPDAEARALLAGVGLEAV